MGDVPTMKIIVCGGRNYNKRYAVFDYLDAFHKEFKVTHVVTGGATGADALGADWAAARGIEQTVMRADWAKHGRSAGLVRNIAMANTNPDYVVAFPGGRGTEHMILVAAKRIINVVLPGEPGEYRAEINALR
jgi:predicted Rossmann-fold nucleotide-binding protein